MSHKIFNVRSRSPLRLGLAGGGTDLSPYCDEYGGAVLNATIDRFAYAHVFPNDTASVVFRARDVDQEETVDPDPGMPIRDGLMLHRAVYARVMKEFCGGVGIPFTLSTTIDVPAGSGLGGQVAPGTVLSAAQSTRWIAVSWDDGVASRTGQTPPKAAMRPSLISPTALRTTIVRTKPCGFSAVTWNLLRTR